MSVVRGRFKFTKVAIDKIAPLGKGQDLWYDTELRGFGLCVSAKKKSYFAEKSFKGDMKRITFSSPDSTKPEDARKSARQYISQIEAGKDPVAERRIDKSSNVTLQEVFDEYIVIRQRCGRLRPATAKSYSTFMRLCFSDWMKLPVTKITEKSVLRRHEELKQIGDSKKKKSGVPMADTAMRILRAVLNWAVGSSKYGDLLKVNPVLQISKEGLWGDDIRRTRYIKPTDLKTFYNAIMTIPNPKGRDYLLLLLFTGMRRTEAMKIKWADVDFNEKTITVKETKNGKPLTLPMSTFLYSLLSRRKAMYYENEYVFPADSKSGHLVSSNCYVERVCKKSGIAFSPHDARRTFLTVAEGLDISYLALKALVNHSTKTDVTAGYIQMTVDRLRAPMQLITDYLMQTAHAWSPWQPSASYSRHVGENVPISEHKIGAKIIEFRKAA